MASQMIVLMSRDLPAFGNTAFKKKARSLEDNIMPDAFVAHIMDSNVDIPDVVDVLTHATESMFMSKFSPVTDAAPHVSPAIQMKEPAAIQARWQELFQMRRAFEKDDLKPITDSRKLDRFHDTWMKKWLRKNLTAEQQQKSKPEQSRIFAEWLCNNYGSKRFVLAMAEIGLTSATPSGATEHSAAASRASDAAVPIRSPTSSMEMFMEWLLRVVKAIDLHKKPPPIEEQHRVDVLIGFLSRRLELYQ